MTVVSIAKARARKALRKFGPIRLPGMMSGVPIDCDRVHVLWGRVRDTAVPQRLNLSEAETLVREGLATLERGKHDFRCNLTIDGIAELTNLLSQPSKAKRSRRSTPPTGNNPKGVA